MQRDLVDDVRHRHADRPQEMLFQRIDGRIANLRSNMRAL
jgi:hypothetical protein